MKASFVAIAVILLLSAPIVGAQGVATKQVVSIRSDHVTSYPPITEGTGKYYTFEFQVPQIVSLTTLEKAHLELYVDAGSFVRGDFRWLDADSVEHVGHRTRTPLLEVYALKSAISGALEEGQLEKELVALVPVLVGQNRRVLVDVTPIVRSFIASPTKNHGIVIGSLSGQRQGDFTLREGGFRDGSRAKISLELAPPREYPGTIGAQH